MATSNPVRITATRTSPSDHRERGATLPAGSTALPKLADLGQHDGTVPRIAPGTEYSDSDVVSLTIVGTQGDLKALGL